jgi:hypothetical protein
MNLLIYRIARPWSGAVSFFCICKGFGLFCEIAGDPPLRFAATRSERARQGVMDSPLLLRAAKSARRLFFLKSRLTIIYEGF